MGKIEANDVRGINLGDEMMCAKCIHMNDRFQEDDVITEDEMGGGTIIFVTAAGKEYKQLNSRREEKMFEKLLSTVGGKSEEQAKSGVKILGIRKGGENGKPLKAFVDVELPGGIAVRNFVILKYSMKGETYVSPPSVRFKDPTTGDVHITRLVKLPAALMSEVRIQALSVWLRMPESH